MANPEHLAILKQGVDVWNKWREDNPGVNPELGEDGPKFVVLQEEGHEKRALMNGNFEGAFFNNMDFSFCKLDGANFCWADLTQTDFSNAELNRAKLCSAQLVDTNFSGAVLSGVDFRRARQLSANFSNARIHSAKFIDIDLSQAVGLGTVHHTGPSTIDIATIFKSKGQIPESFLRGCGVPDEFIKLIPSLLLKPTPYFSCFLSHSSLDKTFVGRLHADLQAAHVRTWYFPEDAKWGKTVWGEIDRSIKIYDKLVVICSKNSLQSGPVLREIDRALQREDREHKNVLFPIAIDKYVLDEWDHPRKDDVLTKVVGDFIGWDTDAAKYDDSFKRLLVELQAED